MLVVEHQGDAGLGRLRLPGLDVVVVRPWRGEALPAAATGLHGLGGLVVLGGEMAAWEDDVAPWLPATRALLAAATARGLPTLGVCLGAQLLALATGGVVERGGAGTEAGLTRVTTTGAATGDALLGRVVERCGVAFDAVAAHSDAVTCLPPDAVLLASSAQYPVQAFTVGAAAWGVQYHPEVSAVEAARWLADLGPALAERGSDPAAETARLRGRERDLAALAAAHDDAFAARALAGLAAPAAARR